MPRSSSSKSTRALIAGRVTPLGGNHDVLQADHKSGVFEDLIFGPLLLDPGKYWHLKDRKAGLASAMPPQTAFGPSVFLPQLQLLRLRASAANPVLLTVTCP